MEGGAARFRGKKGNDFPLFWFENGPLSLSLPFPTARWIRRSPCVPAAPSEVINLARAPSMALVASKARLWAERDVNEEHWNQGYAFRLREHHLKIPPGNWHVHATPLILVILRPRVSAASSRFLDRLGWAVSRSEESDRSLHWDGSDWECPILSGANMVWILRVLGILRPWVTPEELRCLMRIRWMMQSLQRFVSILFFGNLWNFSASSPLWIVRIFKN